MKNRQQDSHPLERLNHRYNRSSLLSANLPPPLFSLQNSVEIDPELVNIRIVNVTLIVRVNVKIYL